MPAKTVRSRSAGARTRQRSFRMREETLRLLDRRSSELHESSNALAQRLIDEALHTTDHPLIVFRDAIGGRRAALIGTRLFVWQVVNTLREHDGEVDDTAAYLTLTPTQVRACLSYYADFREEIEADRATEAAVAEREYERYLREQEALV